ncbi:MAG: hypothetical protein M0Q38_15860 [Bacteroidales bacterium]|jgi:hypothetical protein|nr:hypothetical protein [Bacteroidales bacterium]
MRNPGPEFTQEFMLLITGNNVSLMTDGKRFAEEEYILPVQPATFSILPDKE